MLVSISTRHKRISLRAELSHKSISKSIEKLCQSLHQSLDVVYKATTH